MMDLSHQPQDKRSGTAELPPAPQHDPIVGPVERDRSVRLTHWQFPLERAEQAIQLLSRWAGPFALVLLLAGISWVLIG